jgi:hypothetical protein
MVKISNMSNPCLKNENNNEKIVRNIAVSIAKRQRVLGLTPVIKLNPKFKAPK